MSLTVGTSLLFALTGVQRTGAGGSPAHSLVDTVEEVAATAEVFAGAAELCQTAWYS